MSLRRVWPPVLPRLDHDMARRCCDPEGDAGALTPLEFGDAQADSCSCPFPKATKIRPHRRWAQ
eukprot:3394413-Pyramimonas_sp.AAC.1